MKTRMEVVDMATSGDERVAVGTQSVDGGEGRPDGRSRR